MPTVVMKLTSVLHTRTGRSGTDLAKEIANYLDETGKAMIDRSNAYFLPPMTQEAQSYVLSAQHGKTANMVPEVRNQGQPGQLEARGFVAAHIRSRAIPAASPLDRTVRQDWVGQVAEVWTELLAKSVHARRGADVVAGHRYTLALSPEALVELTRLNLRGTDYLRRVAKETMAAQVGAESSRLDDRAGWLEAFHFDKHHLHLHLLVFPFTEKGRPLRAGGGRELETVAQAEQKGRNAPYRLKLSRLADEVAVKLRRDLGRSLPASGVRALLLEQIEARVLVGTVGRQDPKERAAAARTGFQELARERRVGPTEAPDWDNFWLLLLAGRKPVALATSADAEPTAAGLPSAEPDEAGSNRFWLRLLLGLESHRRELAGWAKEERARMVALLASVANAGTDGRAAEANRMESLLNLRVPKPLKLFELQIPLGWAHAARLAERFLARGEETLRLSLFSESLLQRARSSDRLRAMLNPDFLGLGALAPAIPAPQRSLQAWTVPLRRPASPREERTPDSSRGPGF
jgi:hypothetical protein